MASATSPPVIPPGHPVAASNVAPSLQSIGVAPPKAHASLSDRFKDRFSKFRHSGLKEPLSTEQPPSPSPLRAQTPDPGPVPFPAPQLPALPLPPPALLKSSVSSTLPLNVVAGLAPSAPPSASTLQLPPAAGGSNGKRERHIGRSHSSSPTVSPHHSPNPSTSPSLSSGTLPSTTTTTTTTTTTSSSSSSSSQALLPPPSPLLLPSRPVLGRLHVRVVEGRNLGPASSRTMRTHVLTWFESSSFKSSSFTGLHPFYGHSLTVDVTDVTHDVTIQVVEEHKLTKNAPLGQLITSLTTLLSRDLHPMACLFALDEWIELYPANYDEGPNHLFYHKWPSNEHRITGAGMRKPARWPIGQLHVKYELELFHSVAACYLMSSPLRQVKPPERKKKGKDGKEVEKVGSGGTDVLEAPMSPVRQDGSLVVRSVAPEFHGATFKRNFRRLQRIYNEPAHWMHYARLCQQWEQPLLSLLSLFILYALCFNTRAHHVPLLLLAAVFMVGLASHARQDDSDIITFDTEAIPSEWLREGALHKMRRWRGMLGKASFVLGQVASRVERVSAAFNWTDGHLTLLVYGFLAAATSALTLLLYFVPAGVVVMLIGSAAMLDGLLTALRRWEQDHYTLQKMTAMLQQIEQLADHTGRRKLITDSTPLPLPSSSTPEPLVDGSPLLLAPSDTPPLPSSTPEPAVPSSGRSSGGLHHPRTMSSQLAQVYTSISGVDVAAKKEEMKRAAESTGTTPPKRTFFHGLRRRAKGPAAKVERKVITSFDDATLSTTSSASSHADPNTPPPPYRPRTASVDSAQRPSLEVTPESVDGSTPSASPGSTPRTLYDSPLSATPSSLRQSSSWPGSLSEVRSPGSLGDLKRDSAEDPSAASMAASAHPWLSLLPSRSTLLYYVVTLYSLTPLLRELVRLALLWLRMAIRHLAARAPDSLEVAHRVISERAMKEASVIDSTQTVKRRESRRDLIKKRNKAQPALQPVAQHGAITSQLAQVYSSIQRAKQQVLHPHQRASPTLPQPLSVPCAVAAGLTGRVTDVSGERLTVEAAPASPMSGGSEPAVWEDSDSDEGEGNGSDDFDSSSEEDDM